MAANTISTTSINNLWVKPALNAIGGARMEHRTVSLLTTDEVTSQIYALAILPADHAIIDMYIESAALDSSPTLAAVANVGILNAYAPGFTSPTSGVGTQLDGGGSLTYGSYNSNSITDSTASPILITSLNMITGTTIVQAGGRKGIDQPGNSSSYGAVTKIGVDKTLDRIIALQFTTAPGTAAAGNIDIYLLIDRDQ
jgi:hypothetical protein